MPTSHPKQINELVGLIVATDPVKMLDIGVGFGKYGFLAREYLEVFGEEDQYGQWKRQVDGIEAFQPYLTPVHEYVYDNIFLGDAVDLVPTLTDQYDLTLIVDVLEHFSFERGMQLLESVQQKSTTVIVSVPRLWVPQEDAFENEYETHRFHWQSRHFDSFSDKCLVSNNDSLICVLGDAERIEANYYGRTGLKRRLVSVLDQLHLKEPARVLANYFRPKRATA